VDHTSRDLAFCAYTILGSQPLIVLDAPQDPRFADNELVVGALGIRFYIGAPVFGSTYHPLGALCVIDTGAHSSVSQEQIDSLHALSVEVSTHFARSRG
jgi:GAF domain-containing protein